ncbi:hypothetical protein [Streptomyces macrosporus]|uniref:Integral membrane protein n=1 Tax=Streptomyces macrosporus TaxID=44032 RepID=A0ABN3KEJ5_9ACTN
MGCRAARRLRVCLGRRGTALVILGTGKMAYGAGFLVDPPSPHGLDLLTRFCDLTHWSWLWIACGAVTLASAFVPVGRDRWGFVAALVPPVVWGTAYLTAFLSGTYSRGVWLALWYATSHVMLIVWASRVPEFEEPHRTTARRGADGRPG